MTDAERAELLELYVAEMRRDAWVPGMRCEKLADVSRYYDRAQREVLIMWHDLARADAAAVVRRELDHFRDAGGFTWKVYAGDPPTDFREVLLAAGLRDEHEVEDVLMVASADAMAVPPRMPPNANIRRLATSADIHLLADVWEAVWPNENGGWIDVLAESLDTEPGRLAILVATLDGRPAASGYVVLDPRGHLAYLGGGGVVPEHRGKGLYRALVQARAAIARDAAAAIHLESSAHGDPMPCHLAVEASPASRAVLTRMGFEPLTTLRFYAR
ncbi:MAG: GNAT family N-acetyltransferase [Burkholderiales bacterium]|nr:GNAT family N-acetyltransferase [Burkholderiales bacterium]